MKKLLSAIAVSGLIMLSSCGDGVKNDAVMEKTNNADMMISAENYGDVSTKGEAEAQEDSGITQIDYKQSDVKTINTQMLVYSCDMSIDVMEFDSAVDQFHQLIEKYKGFIESENYSDGGTSTQWKYTEDQKWKSLNAVIRVPSADYDNFCKDAEQVGDMRRKNVSVQNLTNEYSDLRTTLSIYEAKEQRYLDLLKEIKDEKEAVAIESELTEIQIEIARIKTRMNNIESDVAYSYINLTLNEVREYTETPVEIKTDTFGQRLKNTLSATWDGFLEFLEGLLFFIIRVFPYAIIIGILVFIISKLKKLLSKGKKIRKEKKGTVMPQTPDDIPPVVTEENVGQAETEQEKTEDNK